MGVTRCWVLRDRTPVPAVVVGVGGVMALVDGTLVVPIPLTLVGWWGRIAGVFRLYFENYTVDASIFVALSL